MIGYHGYGVQSLGEQFDSFVLQRHHCKFFPILKRLNESKLDYNATHCIKAKHTIVINKNQLAAC
jgi:hypothetical protein